MIRRLDKERSLTAEGAALARAVALRESGAADQALELLLSWSARMVLRSSWTRRLTLYLVDKFAPGMAGYHLTRTQFFDERLRDALAHGAKQIVLLCAGLDSRAHRFRQLLAGVTIFEVDHPQTSAWKQSLVKTRLTDLQVTNQGVRYVTCDLCVDSLHARLLAAGLKAELTTFVIWEGATMYLEEATVALTLENLFRAADSISVAFDYLDQRALDAPSSFPGAKRNLDAVARRGEPYLCGVDPARLEVFVKPLGFSVELNKYAKEVAERNAVTFPTLGFAALAEVRKTRSPFDLG